jgi:hypothetical protein
LQELQQRACQAVVVAMCEAAHADARLQPDGLGAQKVKCTGATKNSKLTQQFD